MKIVELENTKTLTASEFMKGIEEAKKTLMDDNVKYRQPTQFYYPSQKEFVEKWYGVELKSKDCCEFGIRFIEIS